MSLRPEISPEEYLEHQRRRTESVTGMAIPLGLMKQVLEEVLIERAKTSLRAGFSRANVTNDYLLICLDILNKQVTDKLDVLPTRIDAEAPVPVPVGVAPKRPDTMRMNGRRLNRNFSRKELLYPDE